jgi:hypothetical protein
MKTIDIPFSHAVFRLIFEDEILADNFGASFQAAALPAERADYTVEIMGAGDSPYSVCLNGSLVGDGLLRDEAAYRVTRIFGDDICAHVSASVCVMHAASVLFHDRIVSFSGVSGSGKTSLSLFFSKYGSYIGDEYAFLDMETGHLWHEQHPFQLKESNASRMLPGLVSPSVLAVKGEPFGQAYYASLAFTNYKKAEQSQRFKLGVLVFPQFDGSCEKTIITRLSAPKLPNAILRSLMGHAPPSLLLGRFIKMAAKEHIRFLEIRFSDGADAAEKLYACIEKDINPMRNEVER